MIVKIKFIFKKHDLLFLIYELKHFNLSKILCQNIEIPQKDPSSSRISNSGFPILLNFKREFCFLLKESNLFKVLYYNFTYTVYLSY